MSENILICTDKSRDIDYDSLLTFYSFKEEKDNAECNIENMDLIIIDQGSIKKSFDIANGFREKDPSISLLIISDFEKPSDRFFFTKIKGYGQIRMIHLRKEFDEDLLEIIQSLLHPEYPSKRADIAIILPVFNEEQRFQNVFNFVIKLRKLIEDSFINASIYFINDGSKDRTQELVRKLSEEQFEDSEIVGRKNLINTYNLKMNTRKAGTYIESIKSIDADILVFVDADDSFQIEDIALMINILNEGYYDMVIGSKDFDAEDRKLIRRMMSFAKRTLTKRMLPKGVYDSQTGLKAMKSETAKHIIPYLHNDTGLAIDLEILYLAKKMDFRVLQIPVKIIDREGSHVDIVKDSIAFFKNIFRIRKNNKGIGISSKKYKEA